MLVKDIIDLMFKTKNESVKTQVLIDDENCDVKFNGRMELLFNAYEDLEDGDVSSPYSIFYPILTMEVKEMLLGVCDYKGRYVELNLVV